MVMGGAQHRDNGEFLRRIIDESIDSVRSSSELRCSIPRRRGLKKIIPGMVFHEYHELFIQYEGVNRFSLPQESIDLTPGGMLIIAPELPHGERAIPDTAGEFGHLVITPGERFLQCHLSKAGYLGDRKGMVPLISYYERKEGPPPAEIQRLFISLVEAGEYNDEHREGIVSGILLALLGCVRRALESAPERPLVNPVVEDTRRLVLSGYQSSELSVKSLAGQLQLSPDYLSWLFHHHSGVNLSRYIAEVRMERAMDMLRGTDYRISEIAWNCGYASPAYFSRAFSLNCGLSPRDFRNRARGNAAAHKER